MEIKCLTQDFPQGKRVYDADGVAPSLMHTASTMRSQAILVRGGGGRQREQGKRRVLHCIPPD